MKDHKKMLKIRSKTGNFTHKNSLEFSEEVQKAFKSWTGMTAWLKNNFRLERVEIVQALWHHFHNRGCEAREVQLRRVIEMKNELEEKNNKLRESVANLKELIATAEKIGTFIDTAKELQALRAKEQNKEMPRKDINDHTFTTDIKKR